MIVIPTIVLMCTTYKVTKLLNVTTSATTRVLNNVRCKERLKRNQSITRMLIGIIMMFLICHTGKVHMYYYVTRLCDTVTGHKSLSAGCFLKQNNPKFKLCDRYLGGSYLLKNGFIFSQVLDS